MTDKPTDKEQEETAQQGLEQLGVTMKFPDDVDGETEETKPNEDGETKPEEDGETKPADTEPNEDGETKPADTEPNEDGETKPADTEPKDQTVPHARFNQVVDQRNESQKRVEELEYQLEMERANKAKPVDKNDEKKIQDDLEDYLNDGTKEVKPAEKTDPQTEEEKPPTYEQVKQQKQQDINDASHMILQDCQADYCKTDEEKVALEKELKDKSTNQKVDFALLPVFAAVKGGHKKYRAMVNDPELLQQIQSIDKTDTVNLLTTIGSLPDYEPKQEPTEPLDKTGENSNNKQVSEDSDPKPSSSSTTEKTLKSSNEPEPEADDEKLGKGEVPSDGNENAFSSMPKHVQQGLNALGVETHFLGDD